MKSLKQEGVPFGARMVFRLQYLGFLSACIGMLLTIPLIFLWGMVHQSGEDFLNGACALIEDRLQQIKKHRDKLIRLYAKNDCVDQGDVNDRSH